MDSLTEGGKLLLEHILTGARLPNQELSTPITSINVINMALHAKGECPKDWPSNAWDEKNRTHAWDAALGITYEDYSLIKAHCMLIGKWADTPYSRR